MFQFTALPPLSLYVHVPWCVRKCPYCDFNSHELREELPETEYIDALLADLEQDLPGIWGRSVVSVFIGGGTPSLLSAEAIDRLLSGLRARLMLPPDAEITLEANPGTVEQGRFAEYRAAGINRLSIGVQSFNDERLERIGRIHGRAEAIRAAESAHAAGYDDFNLDLMFALPGQDLAEAEQDVRTAIDLEPTHVSHYQLTLEPNTLFAHRPPTLPDEDSAWQMQTACQDILAGRGYTQYEVSAYARTGHRCRHNLNYWRFGDYLGIGAGAHAKVSDAQHQRIVRTSKVRHPRDYVQRAFDDRRIDTERTLSRADASLEFMLNALRLREGFETELFAAHTGLPIRAVEAPLAEAERRGWVEWNLTRIRPTDEGQRLLNDLLGLFLPEGEP